MSVSGFHIRVTAKAALAVLTLTIPVARAETPPASPTPPTQAADPPARVGRLAEITGTVSFHSSSDDHWSPAVMNYPVTAGGAFWTEPSAQAALDVGSSRLSMNSETELYVTQLDAHSFQATEPQGQVYLRLRDVQQGDSYIIQTPRGSVSLNADGRYEVVAGDTQHPTTVTVIEGAAQVTGNNLVLQVGANQTATLTGTDTYQGSVGPAAQDAWLTAMVAADGGEQPVPPGVQAMTGCQDLSRYGTWKPDPKYGQVWVPHVQAGWAPYREGRWSYVAPWGWTWVDAEPWGFAPFHYGRWEEINNEWAWIPVLPGAAVEVRPVYAPALVSFIGVGVGVGLAASFEHGWGGRHIGWVPLGPNEPYFPPYGGSRAYIRELNITTVHDVELIDHTVYRGIGLDHFDNRGAVSFVASDIVTGSRPVGGALVHLEAGELAEARGFGGAPFRRAAFVPLVAPGPAFGHFGARFVGHGPGGAWVHSGRVLRGAAVYRGGHFDRGWHGGAWHGGGWREGGWHAGGWGGWHGGGWHGASWQQGGWHGGGWHGEGGHGGGWHGEGGRGGGWHGEGGHGGGHGGGWHGEH
jgi:hypothetical protein